MDWKHPMTELHHISDSDLTRYHFDAIRGPELAMVEEHLLWCLHCADREEISCAVRLERGRPKWNISQRKIWNVFVWVECPIPRP